MTEKPAIYNASQRSIEEAVSPTPSMRSTLIGYMRPLELQSVTTTTKDFETVEVVRPVQANGIWQPFKTAQLTIRPAGERTWRWFTIQTTTDVVLKTSDMIRRRGENYAVMGKADWSDNGFVEYHVVNSYDIASQSPDA